MSAWGEHRELAISCHNLWIQGQVKNAKRAETKFLNSDATKIVTYILSMPFTKTKEGICECVDYATVKAGSLKVDPRVYKGGTISVKLEPKTNGEMRPLLRFSYIQQANQRLAQAMFTWRHNNSQFEYNVSGRFTPGFANNEQVIAKTIASANLAFEESPFQQLLHDKIRTTAPLRKGRAYRFFISTIMTLHRGSLRYE